MNERNIDGIIILKRDKNGKMVMSSAKYMEEPYHRDWEAWDEFSGTVHTILPINYRSFKKNGIDIDSFMSTSEVQGKFKKTIYGSKDNFYENENYEFLGEGCGFYDFIEESLGENDEREYIIFYDYIRGGRAPGECNVELYECTEENLLKLGLFIYNGEKIDKEFKKNFNFRELVEHNLYHNYRIKEGYDNPYTEYDAPRVDIEAGDVFSKNDEETIRRLEEENKLRRQIYARVDEIKGDRELSVDEEKEIIEKVISEILTEKTQKKHTPTEIAEGIEAREGEIEEVINETNQIARQDEMDRENGEQDGQTQGDE